MRPLHLAALITAIGLPAAAQSLRESMLTDAPFCFARTYDKAHLAAHPDQTVTTFRISPHSEVPQNVANGVVLLVQVERRGSAEVLTGAGYCTVGKIADCGMEGDAGSFTIEPRDRESLLLRVGQFGITFEGQRDFVTLEGDRGDDREFLLHRADPAVCD
ncbi:MAG: hypothetical protein NTX73_04170 [Rhodobacterales bacterium]|nr:hypothetical protein [Rhodobacterales bacterium]